uniref:Peptidase A1 domain-containing protein n=1 Tax=Bursaphelenchus xylophilus TaxID=6326 RepID=A0A1I7RJM0_BURXY
MHVAKVTPATFENGATIVDTGSDVLWVPKLGCQSYGPLVRKCPDVDTYDPAASSTAELTKQSFNIHYGRGYAKGYYYLDNFAFGPKNGPQLKFKEKVKFGAGDKMRYDDDGVLGLSFSESKRGATNIFEQAVKEGLMDKPIFTVFMWECFGAG